MTPLRLCGSYLRLLSGQNLEIVGGGVAGLSLAIALRKNDVAVTLHEAGSYPRHRLCGEFINGVTPATLETLGVSSVLADARTHHTMSWWLKNAVIAEADLPHPVRAISRWEMDQRLSDLLRSSGGEIRERSRPTPEAAVGRVWTAGRRLQKGSTWLGLKAHFTQLEMKQGLEMHLGDAGYVGLTPVEEGRVNVCGLFKIRADLSGKGSERLLAYLTANGMSELVERLRAAQADESSVTGVSGIAFGGQHHDKGLLTLGDAERITPPFTGNGMSMAFEAAECALGPLIAFSKEGVSWDTTRRRIGQRLGHRFDRRVAMARGFHQVILKSPGRELLAAAAKPGLLPFGILNRILT